MEWAKLDDLPLSDVLNVLFQRGTMGSSFALRTMACVAYPTRRFGATKVRLGQCVAVVTLIAGV